MNSSGPSTTVTDADDCRPSTAVINLVARVDGADPVELEPLYHSIDPDVLDSLPDSTGFQRLAFVYEGRTVTVDVSGEGIEISLEDVEFPSDGSTDAADTGSSP